MNVSLQVRVRDALSTAGNRKREGGTWSIVRLCPQTAMMSLDDGAADGESDSHAVALRREKSVEQLVHALTVEAHASIPHGQAHTLAIFPFGSDQQLPRPIVHARHRVGGVADQVQDDLLELDTVAGDGREIVGKLRLKNDPVSLKVAQRQRNDLSGSFVQIKRLRREFLLAE